MQENKQLNGGWAEPLRILTPALLFLLSGLSGLVLHQINGIDDKLFKHLTNDDMHTPKSIIVTQAEFQLYQQFRGREMESIREQVNVIKEGQDKQLSVSIDNNEKLKKLLTR